MDGCSRSADERRMKDTFRRRSSTWLFLVGGTRRPVSRFRGGRLETLMGANKPSGLLSSVAITRLVAQAAMGVAMGLAFTLLLVVINPSGVASLIQNGGGPAVFVGTLVTTFGIGATLSGAVFIATEENGPLG
jgi:hypothetical protein